MSIAGAMDQPSPPEATDGINGVELVIECPANLLDRPDRLHAVWAGQEVEHIALQFVRLARWVMGRLLLHRKVRPFGATPSAAPSCARALLLVPPDYILRVKSAPRHLCQTVGTVLPIANTATDWISTAASCVAASAALAPYIKKSRSTKASGSGRPLGAAAYKKTGIVR